MSKVNNQLIAIIDIGSANVGGAIAELDKNSNQNKTQCANLKYTTRHPLSITDNLTFKTFIKEIFEALDRVLIDIKKEEPTIKQVVVFLASPFCLAQTKIIDLQKDQPFVVTKNLVNELMIGEAKKFMANHKQLYVDLLDDQTIVLENALMQIKLNGYETHQPYGKKSSTVVMAQHLSIMSQILTNKLKDLITQKLKLSNIIFHSTTFATFNTLRDIIQKPNFLIIDISGELTDLLVSVDGYLSSTLTFPVGRNFLIKGLAKKLNTTTEEAYSQLKLYKQGELDSQINHKLAESLESLKGEWLAGLTEALNSVMESVLLPNIAFIMGDDILAQIFAEWMADQSLMQFSLANQPLKTSLIETKDLDDHCLNHRNSNQRFDPFFQIEALFARKVL